MKMVSISPESIVLEDHSILGFTAAKMIEGFVDSVATAEGRKICLPSS